MASVLLALDIGNTSVTAGVFRGKRLVRTVRFETRRFRDSSRLRRQLGAVVGRDSVLAAVYGSVVPALDSAVENGLGRSFGCPIVRVSPRSQLGIRLRVETPEEVGADRLLNALGAFAVARGPAVVVDFGTATTFDCISAKGDYLGGAILPGPAMAAKALHLGTAKLPEVPILRPRRVIGRNTVECIQGGVYFGYLGMIERLLKMTLAEMSRGGRGVRPKVIATGGLARLFFRDLPRGTRLVEDLTLQGLRIAFERTRKNL